MNLEQLKKLYSHERIESYRKYCKNPSNDSELVELYFLNELLSLYFFNLISNIEIILRNRIHNAIKVCYGNNNAQQWYEVNNNIANIFNVIKDNSKNELSKKIEDVLKRINQEEQTQKWNAIYIKNHKEHILVSRLDFGFWNYILANNVDNYKFIENIININTSKTKISKTLFIPFSAEIGKINMLRNRIAHHENILKDISNIEQNFKYCKNIISRMDKGGETIKHILLKNSTILMQDFKDILAKIKSIHV